VEGGELSGNYQSGRVELGQLGKTPDSLVRIRIVRATFIGSEPQLRAEHLSKKELSRQNRL